MGGPSITLWAVFLLRHRLMEELAMFMSESTHEMSIQKFLKIFTGNICIVFVLSCGTEQPPTFQDGTAAKVIAAGDEADALAGEYQDGNDLPENLQDDLSDRDQASENFLDSLDSDHLTQKDHASADPSQTGGSDSGSSDVNGVSQEFNSGSGQASDQSGPSQNSQGTNTNPEVVSVNSENGSYLHTLRLTQSEAAKVDILWVIDSSGSMQKAQEYLGSNMNAFITGLAQSNQNFQTAITTTDICSDSYPDLNRPCPELNGYSGSAATNYKGSFVGDPGRTLLKHDDQDLIAKFNQYAQVGTSGSGWEHGLKGTEMAVAKVLSGENAPLIRDDAFLSIIIVSDEEDDGIGLAMNEGYLGGYNPTAQGTTTFSYTHQELTDYLDSAKGKGLWSVSAITRTRNAGGDICNYAHVANPDPNREEGTAYIAIANSSGGKIQSICEADWSQSLLTIGQDLNAQITQVILNVPPMENTIRVFVDDTEVSGWTFISGHNTIKFNSDSIPAPGAQIKIDFNSAHP